MASFVTQVEISQPVKPIVAPTSYSDCRILVRHFGRPIGWLWFSFAQTKIISEQEIIQSLHTQLGYNLEGKNTNVMPPAAAKEFASISIVVCTRDRTDFLSHCLTALLNLNYGGTFEVIVVDNAPATDATKKLVQTLPVTYAVEARPGLDWARNRGIELARFDIIAFTDDDAQVDANWLHSINTVFLDKNVDAVSGFVAPAELEHSAQEVFEFGYGGMSHGFTTKSFNKEHLSQKQLIWASAFGIGVNMAFRKSVFNKVGLFNVAFDVGTPSHGCGDVEMFQRIVGGGLTMVYEPEMLLWHTHRRSMEGLRKQIKDNGRSFGCYLIHLGTYNKTSRTEILKFFFVNWFWQWNFKNMVKPKRNLPRKLAFAELLGMLSAPFAYRATIKKARSYNGVRRDGLPIESRFPQQNATNKLVSVS